jgi:two-component sensor histidine kinase
MDDAPAQVRNLLRQQAAIAGFGTFALRQNDLLSVLTEAARVCATGLDVPFCKVCRYREAENDLLIEAGCGWKEGVVGHVVSRADRTSPQGRAFITGEPSICNDLRRDTDFKLPAFYAEHGIISTIDVVIKGTDEASDRPYGVLEIDNNKQHDYDQHDVNFLTAFANVLAEAVSTAERTVVLRATIAQMQALVEEKDKLLDQKKILAEELQHRVRNNLQLVYGMLSKQLAETLDTGGRRGIKAIARRVSTLAQVYDHLLGNEMTRTTDFRGFVRSLCRSIEQFHSTPDTQITLSCDSDELILDLDQVTALGIVIVEIVSNSYDHAFLEGNGHISVIVKGPALESDSASITITDNGSGFTVDPESKRHGIGLVGRLIKQIDGTVALDSAHGTAWTLVFPVKSVSGPANDRKTVIRRADPRVGFEALAATEAGVAL